MVAWLVPCGSTTVDGRMIKRPIPDAGNGQAGHEHGQTWGYLFVPSASGSDVAGRSDRLSGWQDWIIRAWLANCIGKCVIKFLAPLCAAVGQQLSSVNVVCAMFPERLLMFGSFPFHSLTA